MRTVEALGETSGTSGSLANWLTRLLAGPSPVPFVLHTVEGASLQVGSGRPVFDLTIRNQAGLRALQSLHELKVAEAYIRGDLDIEGDFIAALSLREALSDRNFWLKAWRRLAPVLFGREKLNPGWIAKHYDLANIQFFATDSDYHTYTPGIYESDDESLEVGAGRKLDFAFRSLALEPGHAVLDVGCGWGGFLRFAAERGVRMTGITLSSDQREFVSRLIEEKCLDAEVLYQDFFSFEPAGTYDGVVLMGVIEDLSDYHRVMKRLPRYVKPGGRVYFDFASSRKPFDTSSFITRYVWPGTFRLVYMPELVDAVNRSPFEVVALHSDRHNYYLSIKKAHDLWVQQKAAILDLTSIEQWRTLRLLFGGIAAVMSSPSHEAGAYRMVLELPASGLGPRRS